MKTKKTSTKGNLTFNEAISDSIDFLHDWAKKELNSISKNNLIVLQNAEGSYSVGTFSVIKITDRCWRVYDRNHELVHDFSRKLASIVYCVFMSMKKYHAATEILDLDIEYTRLDADIDLFVHMIKKYSAKKDDFKLSLYISRQEITKDRLNQVRDQLDKILDRAKYIKLP